MGRYNPLKVIYRTSNRSITTGVLLSTVLLLFAGARVGAGKPAALTDGRDILEKCFGTYARMTSYYGKANTDSLLLDNSDHALKQIGTTVEIKYKRPNKLYLRFMTPVGSRVVWSNSSDLGIYDPSTNKFAISPTAPTLPALLPLLFQKASVTASFDPLYALSRSALPAQLTHIALKDTTNYNGHPVYVVSAELESKKTIDWTWCIDRNSFLLYKIEQTSAPIEQQYAYKQSGQVKHGQRNVRIRLRTVVADARPNAPIADGDFDFKPPSGATERIQPQNAGDKH